MTDSSALGEQRIAAYLQTLKKHLALQGEPEHRALLRLESDLREMALCYQEERPDLTFEKAVEQAILDFGEADALGKQLRQVYRSGLSAKEIWLLLAFPLAFLPLASTNWGAFARQVEPNGATVLGISFIALGWGFYFARRWRSATLIVWATGLISLATTSAYALFRVLFEPVQLLKIATAPQPQLIAPDQVALLNELLSTWGLTRFGFKLVITLLLIFLLLRLAQQEWTQGVLAVFTFLVIIPYRLFDTYIVIDATTNLTQVTYSGLFLSLLQPMNISPKIDNVQIAIYVGGGWLFAALVALYLSLSLNPARYPTNSILPAFLQKFLNYLYGHPRLVRSILLLSATILCLVYQQMVNFIYQSVPFYPSALLAQMLLVAALIFVPRSIIVTLRKISR